MDKVLTEPESRFVRMSRGRVTEIAEYARRHGVTGSGDFWRGFNAGVDAVEDALKRQLPALATADEARGSWREASRRLHESGDDEPYATDDVDSALRGYFDARRTAIRDVVAHRTSPPEYPGMTLVPVADIDRLATFLDSIPVALATADEARGLDVDRLARAIASTQDWTPEDQKTIYGTGDYLDAPHEWYTSSRELAAAIVAELRGLDTEAGERGTGG